MIDMGSDLNAWTGAEAALRRSLERDELRLVYQPILHLTTGTVVGVEAFVRWAHPERGLIPPIRSSPSRRRPD